MLSWQVERGRCRLYDAAWAGVWRAILPMSCLNEPQILAFVEGKLQPEACDELVAHVAGCPGCKERVSRAMEVRAARHEPTLTLPSAAVGFEERNVAASDETLLPGARVDQFEVIRSLGRGEWGRSISAGIPSLAGAWRSRPCTRKRSAIAARWPSSSRRPAPRPASPTRTSSRSTSWESIGARPISRWSTSTARRCVSGDARRRPSLSEALRTTLAIAEALTEAHRHRLLHRDLKPSNAIIPRDGRPRVVDFGLATPLDAPVKGELDHPDGAAARIRGTPAYMAPEQWLGEPLTPACDIWALGVLLYELVGGERPFAGNAESLRARDRRGGATSAPWRERANVAGADRHALPRARALQAAEPV